MTLSHTTTNISGRCGIGLISAPVVAKAASLTQETGEITKRFYEEPMWWLFGHDLMEVSFSLGLLFVAQGVVLRFIELKKNLKDDD